MVTAILLCPGQGAQKVGMGRDLADEFPRAREIFQQIDDALAVNLSSIMWQGPDSDLTLTHNAQPAILAHSLAALEVIRDAIDPVAAAGHSLGEYTAYAAAGAISVTEAARLVRLRGELMLTAGNDRPGTMTVVVGLDRGEVDRVCLEASTEEEVVVPANINSPGQIVISGDPAAVVRSGEMLRERGARRVLPLNVSGAFHSPLMTPAAEGLEKALDEAEIQDPCFPVVANVTAKPVRDGRTARDLLGRQLTAPVEWIGCVESLDEEFAATADYIEIGPGNVLGGLLRRIVGKRAVSAGTAKDIESFMEKVA